MWLMLFRRCFQQKTTSFQLIPPRMGAPKVLHSQLGIQGALIGIPNMIFQPDSNQISWVAPWWWRKFRCVLMPKFPVDVDYLYNHGLLSTPLRRIWILHPGDQTAIGVELLKPKLVLQSKSTEPLMSSLNVFWTGCNSIVCFLSC